MAGALITLFFGVLGGIGAMCAYAFIMGMKQ